MVLGIKLVLVARLAVANKSDLIRLAFTVQSLVNELLKSRISSLRWPNKKLENIIRHRVIRVDLVIRGYFSSVKGDSL